MHGLSPFYATMLLRKDFEKSARFDAHEHAALAATAQSPLIITVGTRWQGGRNGSGAAEGHGRWFDVTS